MGFFDWIVKPFAFVLDIVSFGKLNSEKLINDAIGIALGVTKISTIVDIAQSATGVEILPHSITKTKALGKLTDDLGLGGTFIGKAVKFQENIALANILKDRLKDEVGKKKGMWIEELKGMTFHSQAEAEAELKRKIDEEKKFQETIIKTEEQVKQMIVEKKEAFMVVNTERLSKEVQDDIKKHERAINEQIRKERELVIKTNEDKRYEADKKHFVDDFIIGKKTVAPNMMGWFNQMKGYYHV